MASKSKGEEVFYAPIPPFPDLQNYVVLPLYRRPPPFYHHIRRRCLGVSAFLLFLVAAVFILYPADPDLTLVRLNLSHIQVRTSPPPTLDLDLSLTLKVRNRDFFSLNYSSIIVAIGYRGRELGFVTSNGGRIRARGSSYVNATLVIDGFEFIHDVVYLIEDLARGSISLDTDSVVKGTIRFFFVDIPIKGRVSCEVYVNTNNQTITRQDCYT
ncbi:hypothetical protein U1Q18_028568 [Sarracenia purpurea var. burkii]